jgi:hypothetical protein
LLLSSPLCYNIVKMPRKKSSIPHVHKPAWLHFKKVLFDLDFQNKIKELRAKWGIKELGEVDKFWRTLCEANRQEPGYAYKWYEGQTRDRQLIQDLEALCQDFGFSSKAWMVFMPILVEFDLDNITDANILQLKVHETETRAKLVYYASQFEEGHIYLDVTWASTKDIEEMWPLVRWAQENIRPAYVAQAVLVNLLENIKTGKPKDTERDRLALECARLKDEEHWTYTKLGEALNKAFGYALQEDAYGQKRRCRTAEDLVRRGRVIAHIK